MEGKKFVNLRTIVFIYLLLLCVLINKFCEVHKKRDIRSHTPDHALGLTSLKLLHGPA